MNENSALRTATSADGISANIFEWSGNIVYGFVYDDAGTTKYDQFTLYALVGDTGGTALPVVGWGMTHSNLLNPGLRRLVG